MFAKLKIFFYDLISSGFPDDTEIDVIRRLYLLNLMILLSMFFTFLLGMIAFFDGGIGLGIADLLLFSFLFGILIYLRRTKNWEIAATVIVVVSGIFFVYLIASGGINNSAFVWTFTYPLVAFFLVGMKKGAWASFALLFFAIILFTLSSYVDILANYPKELIIRFIASYITIALFASTMEKTREITQKRLIAMNASLKKANSVKTDLLNITAHDLKNPLNTIRGSAEILNNPEIDQTNKKELIEVIKNSSDSMFHLIEDFLESSRIEDENFKPTLEKIDVSSILSDEITNFQTLALKKNQSIFASVEDNLSIFGVEIYARKIFQNLISNAIKYSPFNSEIRIELAMKDDSVLFKIADRGAGFSEEDKSKVFKRFQRLSAKPTGGESSNGLGLFIVKKLVDLHKGKIWFKSEKGKGTTFFVTFPDWKKL